MKQLGFVSDDTPKDDQITTLNGGRKTILGKLGYGFLTGPARRDLSEGLVTAGLETGFA